MNIVALDLGGTKLSAALLTDRVIRHRAEAPTAARQGPAAQGPAAQGPAAQGPAAQGPAAQGPAAVIDQMVRLLQELPGWEQAEHLAVAATGRVHGDRFRR
ncbi:hypothetical protein [Deinococcus sp. UYEF24]